MIRSLAVLSTKGSRTIIRDPRKAKRLREKVRTAIAAKNDQNSLQQQQLPPQDVGQRMVFDPSNQNVNSLGLGSYVLAGAGMALGFSIVGVLFGGF